MSPAPTLRLVTLAAFLGLSPGCGARSELSQREPCSEPGATRSCQDACGSGAQHCRSGLWSECEVPETVRPCSDPCGSGIEVCARGGWQACEVPPITRACSSVCGSGEEKCAQGEWGNCTAPKPRPPRLQATIRDFSADHPDFERLVSGDNVDPGMVEFDLGADNKPVYAGTPTTPTTSGKEAFDQWYRDVPGVNRSTPIELELSPAADEFAFFSIERSGFFPIDGQLLGNEGRPHNYHFTLEARTEFDYLGGEVFSFTGDDDMWVFINRRLAIDLGGVHASLSATVSLDGERDRLGLSIGQRYPLHFFFAERHTVESNFTIRTSIADPGSCE